MIFHGNIITFYFSALFIIDGKGVLRQITMNDLPVGRSVDETLRLVQAFQYTDEHGEVCPAGWKPGQDTVSSLKVKFSILLPEISSKYLSDSIRNRINFISDFQIIPNPVDKKKFFSKTEM